MFVFFGTFSPALGPIEPSLQWVLGLSLGVKRPEREVHHSPPSGADMRMSGAIPLLLHTFSWRGRGQIYVSYFKITFFIYPIKKKRFIV
jgi:hypothetical protein